MLRCLLEFNAASADVVIDGHRERYNHNGAKIHTETWKYLGMKCLCDKTTRTHGHALRTHKKNINDWTNTTFSIANSTDCNPIRRTMKRLVKAQGKLANQPSTF
jgi:hypothetical protein